MLAARNDNGAGTTRDVDVGEGTDNHLYELVDAVDARASTPARRETLKATSARPAKSGIHGPFLLVRKWTS